MKQASVVASVILAAAILVTAYAIGLLIKQARLDVPETSAQRVVDPNDFIGPNAVNAHRQARPKVAKPTLEERAKTKEERLEQLAQRSDMTEEEKQQAREELRRQMLAKRKDRAPGRVPRLSPDQLAEVRERWPNMSDEEKEAFRKEVQGRPGRQRTSARRTADANEPASTEAQASDPNTSKPN